MVRLLRPVKARAKVGRVNTKPRQRVAVAGMLRSGTSLMTALLERAGLHTGRPDRFVPPHVANPLGFFEHTAVAGMIRRLLDEPASEPVEVAMSRAPEFSARAARLLPAMRELLAELEPHRPWVIKHPSLSLTLPAWAEAADDLGVVVVVRHPGEVVASYDAFSTGSPEAERTLALWEAYTASALAHAAPLAHSVVLHHELLAEPAAAVRRVIEDLDLDLPLPGDGAFADVVRPQLHRQHGSSDELPPSVAALWDRVQAAASRDAAAASGEVWDDEVWEVSDWVTSTLSEEVRMVTAARLARPRRKASVLVLSDRTLVGDRAAALARRSWMKVDSEVDVRFVIGNEVAPTSREGQPADLRAHLPGGVELPKGPVAADTSVAVGDFIVCGTPDARDFAADAPLQKARLALQLLTADDDEAFGADDVVVIVDDASHVALVRLAEQVRDGAECGVWSAYGAFGDRSPVVVARRSIPELLEALDRIDPAEHGYPRSLAGALRATGLEVDGRPPIKVVDYSDRPPAGHQNNLAAVTLFSPTDLSAIEWFHDRFYRHLRPALAQAEPNVAADDRIFIQIPSYRDPQLPKTIASAFEHAADPSRVRFGVCWQYDEWTADDLEPWIDDERVSIDEVYYVQSKGCCWARQRANEFYDGEGYFLQIDAHMRFAPNWDDRMIAMLEACDAPKPIITTYPPPLTFDEDGNDVLGATGLQRLNLMTLSDGLATRQGSDAVPNADAPGPSRFLAGGFNFSHGQLVKEVPSDPDVYFSGEEVALAVRAFTHGYDLFYPNENVIWHLYAHEAPKHWTDTRSFKAIHEQAIQRMRTLLIGDHTELGRFGLGSVRSVGDYETMAGVDFRAARLELPHVEPTEQMVRFSLEGLVPDACDVVVCTLLDEAEVELARVDQIDPEVLSGNKTDIAVKVRVPGKVAHCAVLARTPEGFEDRVVVEVAS